MNLYNHNILVENNEGKCVREGFIKEESIKLLKRGKVRRAKLYYLRSRKGKAAKIKTIEK